MNLLEFTTDIVWLVITLFGSEKHGAIYDRIRYLISQKVTSHVFVLTIS